MIRALDGPASRLVEMSVFVEDLAGARLAGFFAVARAAGFFALVLVVRLVAMVLLPCLTAIGRMPPDAIC